MTVAVATKLLVIMLTVALGWLAARVGWLGHQEQGQAHALVLSNLAFYLFVPALLFRTMVRLDLASLPWPLLYAYFVPALAFSLAVYAWQRRSGASSPAAPATRTVAAVYGNAVQLGIPMAAALFGETGLALHIALVSVHGLVLLTLMTVLVETDLARASGGTTRWQTLRSTLRNTLIHPVVLPILLGLATNLLGLPMPEVLDQTLAGLGSAVVPLCLVLIGVSLSAYGVRGGWRDSLRVFDTQAAGVACTGAGSGALGLRAGGHAAGRAGDDGRAAGGQQRVDLCAALRHAASRSHGGHRRLDSGFCADRHVLAGRAGPPGNLTQVGRRANCRPAVVLGQCSHDTE